MNDQALRPGTHVHLVGIGGAGMSALARVLLERGHPTSGSDHRGGPAAEGLRDLGATIHLGHAAEHVDGADLVVVSTAIPPDNPEVRRAREAGIPVLRRAELLAALISGRRGLLVAGTHGKTTTTSMVASVLTSAGLDPSFAIGGVLEGTGTSARHGKGDVFVAEADESDGSFLVFGPDCAIVTNVELDHHDHWTDLDEVTDAFLAFLGQRSPGGLAVLCRDDPGSAALADEVADPVLTYGESAEADLRITDVRLDARGARFGLFEGGTSLGDFALRLPGRHNVANAAAAVAACRWAGADMEAIRRGLGEFAGARRRFTAVGTARHVRVVDDYAHHPTELRVVLAAARQAHPDGRVVAVFQPHRYSRTAALGADLGRALATADLVVVTEVYPSGEDPLPGVSGATVADACRSAGATTRYAGAISMTDLAELVAGSVREGDLVLTLGAGDITEVGPALLARLEGSDGDG